MTYQKWINQEAARIESELRARAKAGEFNLAVYVLPAQYPAWGKLVLASEKPEGASDVLRFPTGGYTTNISTVPYSMMNRFIWDACRTMPVCGE